MSKIAINVTTWKPKTKKVFFFFNRSRKSPFSSAFSGVSVWMIDENASKKCAF